MEQTIITVELVDGIDIYEADNIYQYDRGDVLKLTGLTLPTGCQVHFGFSANGKSKTALLSNGEAVIPQEFTNIGAPIYAWVYISGEDYGATKKTIKIPVAHRGEITDEQPTQEQESTIDQYIALLQETTAEVEENYTELSGEVGDLKSVINNGPDVRNYILGSTTYWAQPTGSHIAIGVNPEDTVYVKANSANAAYFGVLRSYTVPTSASSVQYSTASGFTGRLTLAKNATSTYTMPSDAVCIVFNNYYTTTFLPAQVLVNGLDVLTGIRADIKNLKQNTAILDYTQSVAITSGDLNDCTTPGNYYISTFAQANAISNTPIFANGYSYAGRLTVSTVNSANVIMQEYDSAQNDYRAWRIKTNYGWSDWYMYTTRQTVESMVNGTAKQARALAIGSFNAVRNVMSDMTYQLAFANAPVAMDFPNYLGNTQNVHPKVLYIENGFGGHKYWMSYTPYPYSDDTVENPCVAYSDDGYAWVNIAANPLAAASGNGDYNSDAHLVYRSDTGTLECWYRRVGASVDDVRTETLYRRITTDGITWAAESQVMFNDGTETGMAYSKLLSPAVIWDGSKYCMWVIANSTYIDYYESANATSWTLIRRWTLKPRGSADIRFNENDDGNTNTYPWHLDVIKDGSTYVMLVMCRNSTAIPGAMCSIYIITSADNVTYSANGTKVIGGSKDNWDKYMYRASIVKVGDVYRIYYSAGSGGTSTIYNNAVWGIGITESDSLSGFIGRMV